MVSREIICILVIGPGCFLPTGDDEEPFNVTCSNHDADGALQPVPIPMVAGLQLLDIDVAGGRMWVYSWVNSRCRSNATFPKVHENTTRGYKYNSTTFRVSDTENVLTVVGCNVLAYIGTQDSGGVENRYVAACNASCRSGGVRVRRPLLSSSLANNGDGGDSSCDGMDGCCKTTTQQGIGSVFPSFVADENRSDGSGSGSSCGYAFLVEKEKFKFRTSYVSNRELAGAAGKRLPLVLDWAVGNKTCQVAQKDSTTYACRSDNHRCEGSKNGPGYLCKCKTGYRGNPYVENGCQREFSLLLRLVLLVLLIIVVAVAVVSSEFSREVLGMVAALAKRCLEMSGEKRPPMREFAEELDRIRKLWWQRCFGEVASDDR